jgi:hypothetical protein
MKLTVEKLKEMCNSIEHSWRLKGLLFPYCREANGGKPKVNKYEGL